MICTDSNGIPADDSMCSSDKPPEQQDCNAQSCTNANCNPVWPGTYGGGMARPATGPAPLTVTFNIPAVSTFAWDYFSFGDGSTVPTGMLTVRAIPEYSVWACVNHTYTRAGTFIAGRIPRGAAGPLQDATVRVY